MRNLFRASAPALQWLLAVGLLAVAVAVGYGVLEVRRVVMGDAVGAAETPADTLPPTSIPAGAVSLPVLLFNDAKGIRLGDTIGHVAALIGRSAEVGRDEIGQAAAGKRLMRFYEYRGRRFALVFTLAASYEQSTVTAIYLE